MMTANCSYDSPDPTIITSCCCPKAAIKLHWPKPRAQRPMCSWARQAARKWLAKGTERGNLNIRDRFWHRTDSLGDFEASETTID